MNRRAFITGLGGAVVWPLAAQAQPADRVRRVGVLAGLSANDSGIKPRLVALQQELERWGWVEGHNVRTVHRFAPAAERVEEAAKQLIALQPDVIVAHTVAVATALQRETRVIPIVFVSADEVIE
jgi:putative ABC transport system substrate-binding protein